MVKKKKKMTDKFQRKKKLEMNQLDLEDIPITELKRRMLNTFNEKVRVTEREISDIEASTKNQSGSAKRWHMERKKRLMSSQFGPVMSLKKKTSCVKKVYSLLYYDEKFRKREDQKKRRKVREQFRQSCNKKVVKSGLVVDKDCNYLAASPDGIVKGENAIIKIKFNKDDTSSFEESLKKKAIEYIETVRNESGSSRHNLKKKHLIYYQIQGALNILKLDLCYFVISNPKWTKLKVFEISRDERLWLNEMIPKLSRFYMTAMLPEIACPRYSKSKRISHIREFLYNSARDEDDGARDWRAWLEGRSRNLPAETFPLSELMETNPESLH